MTADDTVRTEQGTLVVRNGELRVRRTVRGVLRKVYLNKWADEGISRRVWFVLSTLLTFGTLVPFIQSELGFSNRLLSTGTALSLAAVVAVLVFIPAAIGRLLRDTTVRLSEIREVEREDDEPTLRLLRASDDETEIEFPTEREAERAAELLRYNGLRVFDLGPENWSRRTEIEREEEGETE